MSNNTLIGALRAEATLESGKFVDGAKKIRNEAKKTETQLKSSFGNMGKSVAGFGTALTAGLSIGLLTATVKKALDYASSLKTISQQAGVTTKDLQTLRYAATQNGLTVAQFDDGLTKLKDTLGKVAAGSAAPTKALNALGITAKQINGVDTATAFKMISDKLAAIPDPAKRAAFELALFGQSGSKLDPLLSKGSESINTLAQAAQDLGIVLSDRQIQSADETAAKLDQVKMVLAAQISGVVADNASSIVSLAGALAQLTGAIANFLGSNPTAAVAILGALAGGRVGGLPGAALGALAGANVGLSMARNKELANTDLKTRVAALRKAQSEYRAAKKIPGAAGSMATTETAKRLRQEIDATNRARAVYAASKNAPAGGGGTIPQFLAPAGPKPKSGPRPRKGPRDRSEHATYQVQQEQMRADMDILRAKQSLAHGDTEKTALSLQMLDLEKQMFEAEQAHKLEKAKQDLAEGRITKAAYDEVVASEATLKAKYDEKDALERRAIAEDLTAKKQEEAARLVDSDFSLQIELLQNQAQLATTTRDKLAIELRILDAMKEQERARLEAVLADKDAADAAKEEARRRLAALDQIYGGRAEAARQGNRTPLQDYKARHANIGEANEQAVVSFLEAEADALSKVTDGWKAMKEAALDAVKSLLQTLLRNQLNQLISGIIPSNLGGLFGGGSSGGGMSASQLSAIVSGPAMNSVTASLPKMANGGSFRIGGLPGIDKNLLSMNGSPLGWVSLGERIDVSNDNGRAAPGRRPLVQNFNFPNSDFNSFKRGERQAARLAKRGLGRA